MSFSVRGDAANWEYEGSSLGGLFAQKRNLVRPAFYRMLRDILRFNRRGPAWAAGAAERETVGEFLARHGFSHALGLMFLAPMVNSSLTGPVLSACVLIHGLLAVFRTLSLVMFAGVQSTTYVFAGLEWLLLLVAGGAWWFAGE